MEIGIIGKGKMGWEIFNYLLDYDNKLVLICRKAEDIEILNRLIENILKKKLKRGYLDASLYEKKRQSFIITNELSYLRDCNIVIESIAEDKELKQKMFKQLESIVSEECILATNTSSISLNDIFKECKKKDRCLGIHFFFPVKMIKTVEINKFSSTMEKYVEVVRVFLMNIKKEPIELEESANMVLNKILAILIAQANIIREENYLEINEIDQIIREKLLLFGLFEIIDSVGLNIISQSFQNFNDIRYKKLYTHTFDQFKEIQSEGYIGGNGNKGIFEYEKENPVVLKKLDDVELNKYKEKIILRLQSILINELVFLIQSVKVERTRIIEAVKEVLGLSEDPIYILKQVGHEKVSKCLLDSYKKFEDDIYKLEDLSVLKY